MGVWVYGCLGEEGRGGMGGEGRGVTVHLVISEKKVHHFALTLLQNLT